MPYDSPDKEAWAGPLSDVERRVLTLGWVPDCLLDKTYDCSGCPFQNMQGCPVEIDPGYGSYLLWLRDRYLQDQGLRQKRIVVLKSILNSHKLPLHWEVLAVLAFRVAPDLFDSAQSVKALLYFNPYNFFAEGDGVFSLTEWQRRDSK